MKRNPHFKKLGKSKRRKIQKDQLNKKVSDFIGFVSKEILQHLPKKTGMKLLEKKSEIEKSIFEDKFIIVFG